MGLMRRFCVFLREDLAGYASTSKDGVSYSQYRDDVELGLVICLIHRLSLWCVCSLVISRLEAFGRSLARGVLYIKPGPSARGVMFPVV